MTASKPGILRRLRLSTPYQIVLAGNSRRLALISMYTAAYLAVVEVFPFLSYGQVNIRVADLLRGLLPFFPNELILANILATFLSDLQSPFGYFDFIGSTCVVAVSITVCVLIQRRSIIGGFIAHTAILGTWLSWLIWYVGTGGNAPFWSIAVWVYGGNIVSDIIMPYAFFQALKPRLLSRKK